MEKIRTFFTQKAGPLPVWAWAAILLALIGAYAYWKKLGPFAGSSTGTSTAPTTSALYDPTAGNGNANSLGGTGLPVDVPPAVPAPIGDPSTVQPVVDTRSPYAKAHKYKNYGTAIVPVVDTRSAYAKAHHYKNNG